jgi:hypothetical protein
VAINKSKTLVSDAAASLRWKIEHLGRSSEPRLIPTWCRGRHCRLRATAMSKQTTPLSLCIVLPNSAVLQLRRLQSRFVEALDRAPPGHISSTAG